MGKDKTVTVTVIKRLPIGLLVRLENGEEGIIRVRETSWDVDDRRRWQELYPENWTSQAVILADRKGKTLELSLRLAKNDPWDGVPGRYRRGQVVRGIVSGVMNYGVFVDISTGITGLLHVSELPTYAKGNPQDLFWPGDHLLVSIVSIDLNRRRIGLGLPQTYPGFTAVEGQALAAGFGAQGNWPDEDLAAAAQTRQNEILSGHRHVLVIEDDKEQAEALSSWFERIGHRVDVSGVGRLGLQIADQDPPDIAVVDLTLPDMLGLEVLQMILERFPECHAILITDWARADEHVQALEALQARGVSFLLKPFMPNDMLEVLRSGKEVPSDHLAGGAPHPNLGRLRGQTQATNKTALLQLVRECQDTLKFDLAALFALDPIQRTVELVCASGSSMKTAGLTSLVFSPVRDAAEDGEEVLLEDLSEHDIGRFRYLMEVFPLQACCGVRVPSNASRRFTLFLFHGTPKKIPTETLVYARGVSLAIGALLDRQIFQEHAILVQRTALLGHLTRGLVHETNHQIGGMNLSLGNLEDLLCELKHEAGSQQAIEAKIDEALDEVSDLQRSVSILIDTTRQFGGIITRPKEEFLRIDEPIKNAIKLLRDVSDRAKVKIHFQPPESLKLIRSQGAIVEQILINVLLNAIQQINLHPRGSGWVQVLVESKRGEEGERLRVVVEDSGPGIHLRQWEQVFDVGYTTREEGSGMGLYISRSLVEALGGRLYVEESFIFGGTIFVLELPSNV